MLSRRSYGGYTRQQMTLAIQRRVHRLCSRAARRLYGLFPIFGRLRGAIAIIQCGNRYLVIDRSDGLGLSFPGGVAAWGESDLATVRRELLEETGLILIAAEELFEFESDVDLPAVTTVFRGEAEGQIRGSWEGTPQWISLAEIEAGEVFSPHQPVFDYLKQLS